MLQWWPMVPRLDWQQIKNALKPLLLTPRWSILSAIEAALALMVVAVTVRHLRMRAAVVLTLVVVGALGKLLMVHQALTLSRVVGWSVGLIGAWLLWRLPARTAAWGMAAAALAWFTVDELRPFEFADALGEFHWLPFAAMLQGSLVANTLGVGMAAVLAGRRGVAELLARRTRRAGRAGAQRVGPAARVVADVVTGARRRHHAAVTSVDLAARHAAVATARGSRRQANCPASVSCKRHLRQQGRHREEIRGAEHSHQSMHGDSTGRPMRAERVEPDAVDTQLTPRNAFPRLRQCRLHGMSESFAQLNFVSGGPRCCPNCKTSMNRATSSA